MEPHLTYYGTILPSVNLNKINLAYKKSGIKFAIVQAAYGGSRMKMATTASENSTTKQFFGIQLEKSTVRNILITIYVLFVLGLSATARAEMRILPNLPKISCETEVSVYGSLIYSIDTGYLISKIRHKDGTVTKGVVYTLIPADKSAIDLKSFNNKPVVKVYGCEANKEGGPYLETKSVPGIGDVKQHDRHPLIINKISEVRELDRGIEL